MDTLSTHDGLKKEFSTDRRKELAKSGAALPDGSYPIESKEDLSNAIQAFGRANPSDRGKVRAHIIKRAKALGATDMLPADWPGSTKEEGKSLDTLILFGGEVKATGGGNVEGYLVKFSSADDPDLEGDFFTPETDFDVDFPAKVTIYYNHCLDPNLKGRKLGRGEIEADEFGIWVKGQIAQRDEDRK